MQKIRTSLFWTLMLSESMHVFCCVLPTIISIVSLVTGAGVVTILPTGLLSFHNFMHKWELPMIGISGVILALGWGLHVLSQKLDCHSTGCGHGPCSPKKNISSLVLTGATALFVFNTAIYFIFHRG